MKKLLLVLFSLLGLTCCFSSAMAQSLDTPSPQPIQEVSLDTVKAKIKAKETFFLFVGRTDNLDTQKALPQLEKAQAQTGQVIYFLNTRGINGRSYKAFAKKYQIKSPAHLAQFSNRQQVAIYHNNWLLETDELVTFLSSPRP